MTRPANDSRPPRKPLAHIRRLLLGPTLLVAASLACVHTPLKNEVDVDALLREAPDAAFVSGRALGLGDPEVLNDKDFIYAVAFDREAGEVAFVHHVTTHMELTVRELKTRDEEGVATGEDLEPRFHQPVNRNEFDVEDVVFIEHGDERFLITPSRQGIIRRFRAKDGAAAGEFIYGEPSVRVALNPSQTLLAIGSDAGRILVIDAETLAFRGEARPHDMEIRGLVFADDNRILSTSFDGQLVETTITPGTPDVARLGATKLDGGGTAFLMHLDGTSAVSATRDVRQPSHVITRSAVERLGLKPVMDGTTLPVLTSLGADMRPAVELGELQLRYFSLGTARAAVCDDCVPGGAELVIGQPGLARIILGDDFSRGEILAKPGRTRGLPEPEVAPAPVTDPAPASDAVPATDAAPATDVAVSPAAAAPVAAPVPGSLLLVESRRVKLPGPGNDVNIDARGQRAVVAYSHAPAVRDPDIYDEEKKDNYPPASPASGAVIVDMEKFELGRRLVGHRGFTVTADISPDGRTVVSGGWDKRFIIFDADTGQTIEERKLAWLLRRVRFSHDGRLLAVAAWTPVNPFGEGESEPALIIYPVVFDTPTTADAKRVSTR